MVIKTNIEPELWKKGKYFIAFLPLPPCLNAKFRFKSSFVLTREYRSFKEMLPVYALKYKLRIGQPIQKKYVKRKLIRNVEVVHTYHTTETKRDIDAMEKVLNDALQGVFYENDIQIKKITKQFVQSADNMVEVVCFEVD